jgi:MFS family permease
MGLVHNLAGLVVTRVFLGMFESGFFPGICFYLTMWYRRTEYCIRLAIFFSIATMAGAFSGLLAFGIGHMAGVGGKNSWSWIFMYSPTPSEFFVNLISDLREY